VTVPATSDFLRGIDEFLATFTPEEQAVTRAVFRSVLEGHGIRSEAVARTVQMSLTAVERAVDRLVERGTMERDTEFGELVAARGLSLAETPHRLTLDGRQLYAFCAVDAVGIPAALGADARAESRCHVCGAPVILLLAAGKMTDASSGAVIWAVERDLTRSLHRYT
jgi:alkylmercury lyase